MFRKFCHPVILLALLQGGTPQPFRLLGEEIVLFLGADGEPKALKDRCCHRTARLSKGRCVNGALENSFDNSHFSFVHRATFGVAAQPRPSRYEIVEQDAGLGGFHAETVIAATHPPAFHRVSGRSEPITQRRIRPVG